LALCLCRRAGPLALIFLGEGKNNKGQRKQDEKNNASVHENAPFCFDESFSCLRTPERGQDAAVTQ